jgi:hypothetical protein
MNSKRSPLESQPLMAEHSEIMSRERNRMPSLRG